LKKLQLLTGEQRNFNDVFGDFVADSGGDFDVFNAKVMTLAESLIKDLTPVLGGNRTLAAELVKEMLAIPDKIEFDAAFDKVMLQNAKDVKEGLAKPIVIPISAEVEDADEKLNRWLGLKRHLGINADVDLEPASKHLIEFQGLERHLDPFDVAADLVPADHAIQGFLGEPRKIVIPTDADTDPAFGSLFNILGRDYALTIQARLDDRPLQEALDRIRRGVIGGGPIGFRPAFSAGGHVPGPKVDRDVVPAMLTPGEVVIRKVMVDRFGLDELLALNRGVVPPGWVVPRRFADGGEVPDVAAQAGAFLASVAPQMPLSAPWAPSQAWAAAVPPSTEVAAYTAMLHEAGQAQRVVELAAAPSVSERARQVAHSLSVEFGARPAERTAGDERPVGEAVKASLDRFEERSLAILAAALDQRPLVGSLTVQGKGDGRRDAATIVRELAGARWRMGV
jgi:hypothetical protein